MNYDIYQLITEDEARELAEELKKSEEWEKGKGRTKRATKKLKNNFEMPITSSFQQEASKIRSYLVNDDQFLADHTPKQVFLPRFNKYEEGEGYKRHSDSPWMGGVLRTDLSCTIFLSDIDDYDGGELCIETPSGQVTDVKLLPGMAVVYPSYYPHWVEPILEGTRICAITWIQSRFQDLEQRSIIRSLNKTLKTLEQDDDFAYSKEYTDLSIILGKLTRMWMET